MQRFVCGGPPGKFDVLTPCWLVDGGTAPRLERPEAEQTRQGVCVATLAVVAGQELLRRRLL